MRWPLVRRDAMEDIAERRDLMRNERDEWRARALKWQELHNEALLKYNEAYMKYNEIATGHNALILEINELKRTMAANRSPGKSASKKRKARQ